MAAKAARYNQTWATEVVTNVLGDRGVARYNPEYNNRETRCQIGYKDKEGSFVEIGSGRTWWDAISNSIDGLRGRTE
jgi:hypothetical protein